MSHNHDNISDMTNVQLDLVFSEAAANISEALKFDPIMVSDMLKLLNPQKPKSQFMTQQ